MRGVDEFPFGVVNGLLFSGGYDMLVSGRGCLLSNLTQMLHVTGIFTNIYHKFEAIHVGSSFLDPKKNCSQCSSFLVSRTLQPNLHDPLGPSPTGDLPNRGSARRWRFYVLKVVTLKLKPRRSWDAQGPWVCQGQPKLFGGFLRMYVGIILPRLYRNSE